MIDKELIRPVGKYILVERYEEPKKATTILLANAETFVSNKGYVIDTNRDSAVKPGQFIIWSHYAGYGIDKEQPRLIVIKEEEVIAVLPEPGVI